MVTTNSKSCVNALNPINPLMESTQNYNKEQYANRKHQTNLKEAINQNPAKRSLFWRKKSSITSYKIVGCCSKRSRQNNNKCNLYRSKNTDSFQSLALSSIIRLVKKKRGNFLLFANIIRNSQERKQTLMPFCQYF